MSGKKKVKKKRIEPRVAKRKEVVSDSSAELVIKLGEQFAEAVQCLKHYIKLAGASEASKPAKDLLTKWGVQF